MVQDIRSIALSHQAPEKTVTKTEILAALKNLTAEERLEIIETASRMMREEIEEKAQRKAERKRKLRAAAEAAVPLYEPGRATSRFVVARQRTVFRFRGRIPQRSGRN